LDDHKFFVAALAQERLIDGKISPNFGENAWLNLSMEAMFRLATCKDGCRGGDHIYESLVGRTFNQIFSAIILTSSGLYDEALNLLRSAGETANLLTLFVGSPESFTCWINLSERERKNGFSPAKVRIQIEKLETLPIPMAEEDYSNLSGFFVHPQPRTRPNSHAGDGICHVGGVVQPAGDLRLATACAGLASRTALISLALFSKWDEVDALQNKMSSNT
jgi:hypothetical protein